MSYDLFLSSHGTFYKHNFEFKYLSNTFFKCITNIVYLHITSSFFIAQVLWKTRLLENTSKIFIILHTLVAYDANQGFFVFINFAEISCNKI